MSSAVLLQSMLRPAAPGLGRQLHGSPSCRGSVLRPRRLWAVPMETMCCDVFRRNHYGGALVDEGMTVLRRRIREARMAETNYEAPPGWAALEKRYYPAYVSDVSTLAGALQLLAMDTRPVVAAAVALVLAGVPFPPSSRCTYSGRRQDPFCTLFFDD